MLIEEGKAQIVERRTFDCREWLTVLTVPDELPGGDIVKPDVSDERLAQLREMARERMASEASFEFGGISTECIQINWPLAPCC